MNPLPDHSAGRPTWLTEDPSALADFWAVCERHFQDVLDQMVGTAHAHPEFKAWSRAALTERTVGWGALLRRAVEGDWAPYEESLRAQGAQFATLGLTFQGCFEIAGSFYRYLLPRLIETYAGKPERLSAVLVLSQRMADHALATLSQQYVRTQHLRVEEQQQALRASEERYRLLFESSPLPMWVYDTETLAFLAVNEAAIRHYGYSRSEFTSMTLKDIRPADDVPALLEHLTHLQTRCDPQSWKHLKKDGTVITVEVSGHQMSFDGRSSRLVLSQDVTERKLLEEQFRQAQKMDAVGQLAGGIAHDFNNLLTAILSFSEFVLTDLGPAHKSHGDVQEVIQSARRAAALTRQLLAFSRRQILKPEILNINDILASTEKILKRVIGEHIDLVTVPAADLRAVRVDRGHLEQMVLNLMVNARDAMPDGGKLTIETANVDLDDTFVRGHLSARPGRYVMLAVTDTGAGMDAQMQTRIFEPFFTTKEVGKGVGLGLSTVFGIVKQNDGDILVYSGLGRGTTFKIYLPEAQEARELPAHPISFARRTGDETVLLVEDDEAVRAVAVRTLRLMGHAVLDVADPREALRLIESHQGPIHLLITDVVMPQMNGNVLAEQISRVRGDSRVLFMSGYTGAALIHQGVFPAGAAYLEKPFTPDLLAEKVRSVLDSPAS